MKERCLLKMCRGVGSGAIELPGGRVRGETEEGDPCLSDLAAKGVIRNFIDFGIASGQEGKRGKETLDRPVTS